MRGRIGGAYTASANCSDGPVAREPGTGNREGGHERREREPGAFGHGAVVPRQRSRPALNSGIDKHQGDVRKQDAEREKD